VTGETRSTRTLVGGRCAPRDVVFAGTLESISRKRRDRFLADLRGGGVTDTSPASSASAISAAGGASSVAAAHLVL
jgi:hypothetical protein